MMVMSGDARIDVESEIDRLYGSPLAEFVVRRDALAKALRKAGDLEMAARVKSLSKPSVSAWAVNQVHWAHPEAFQKLADSGQRLRDAQSEGAPAVREASGQRREAVAEALRLAERILREGGNSPGPNILKRVETNFESLAAWGSSQPDPPPGRLIEDVAAPGFEALAGWAVAPAAARSRPAPKKDEAKRASKSVPPTAGLALQLTRARRDLDKARREEAAASKAREKALAAARQELVALDEARRRWREAAERLGESDDRVLRATRLWQAAAALVARAEALAERLEDDLEPKRSL